MVYIILADKRVRYPNGRSRVIYIGTTKRGSRRPASNAADKAMKAFEELYGVKNIHVHLLTCQARQAVKTWEELESALLVTFKFLYGKLPRFNYKMGSCRDVDDIKLFKEKKLRSILRGFENLEA
jgi:hypothetical protein